jgi:hypothetical protein
MSLPEFCHTGRTPAALVLSVMAYRCYTAFSCVQTNAVNLATTLGGVFNSFTWSEKSMTATTILFEPKL